MNQPELNPREYSIDEVLRDGGPIHLRAIRPSDKDLLFEHFSGLSQDSRYTRFFGAKRTFSDNEVAFFVNVDFAKHVALVVVAQEDGHAAIIAGGRYVVGQPGSAEVAFVVIDKYQGQGIGALLLRHLAKIARDTGLKELTAEVLPENIPMLKVFEKSGLKLSTRRESGAVHVVLQLA